MISEIDYSDRLCSIPFYDIMEHVMSCKGVTTIYVSPLSSYPVTDENGQIVNLKGPLQVFIVRPYDDGEKDEDTGKLGKVCECSSCGYFDEEYYEDYPACMHPRMHKRQITDEDYPDYRNQDFPFWCPLEDAP